VIVDLDLKESDYSTIPFLRLTQNRGAHTEGPNQWDQPTVFLGFRFQTKTTSQTLILCLTATVDRKKEFITISKYKRNFE